MAFFLPATAILTAVLTYETVKGAKKKYDRKKQKRENKRK